jgi:trans-aconitate methyltransferase
VSWFQDNPQPSLDLISDLASGPDAPIVDIGGGASRLVDALLDRGFRALSVLDLSPSALHLAQDRLGERAKAVRWIAADATRWTPERPQDIWHDRAAFHFLIAPEQRAAYVARMAAALRPGGHAVIGAFAPDGPERCSGLPVARYDVAALARELGPAFIPVSTRPHAHLTPAGVAQRFLFSVFRRA